MEKKCFLMACLMMCSVIFPLPAQPQPKRSFSPQDFVKHLESFIVREACLTPTEATAFFPIFHEMHDKQRGINWEIRELKKRSLPANATDKDYYSLIKEINSLKMESAEIEDSYYKKMCKAVSARKVHAAMQAEDRFHRRMLRKFSDRAGQPQRK